MSTLSNLIQHSPLISFGDFCQPLLLFQTSRLLIHVHTRQRQCEAQEKPHKCLLYMLFLPHRTKLFSDYNEARRSVKRRIKQKTKRFFMQINYLCIPYVLFVDIFTRSFDDFISLKFLFTEFLLAPPFIPTSRLESPGWIPTSLLI